MDTKEKLFIRFPAEFKKKISDFFIHFYRMCCVSYLYELGFICLFYGLLPHISRRACIK